MPACPRCGSRSVEIVLNPLTFVVHVVSHERRTRCPRCGWTGWKHKQEWAHAVGAGIWRGAGGIKKHGHSSQTHPADGVSGPLPDAVFEKAVTEEHAAPDLAAVDRAFAEHERLRAERRAQQHAATTPGHSARGPRKKARRKDKPVAGSSSATLGKTDRHDSDHEARHRERDSSIRRRISRRARRAGRNRLILLAVAATAVLAAIVLITRACE